MTLSITVDGTTLPHRVRLRGSGGDGILGLSQAADGGGGSSGGIVIDDPNHDLTLRGWSLVAVEESDCTDAPRLGTGYMGDRVTSRGNFPADGGRQIDCTIYDLNTLLKLRLIDGNDGQRPAENRQQRIDWLLASAYLDGIVFDVGWIADQSGFPLSESDYRGQYAADVLANILSKFQTFFVKWDPVTESVGLFFDDADSTTDTCSLTISNDPDDNDFNVCWPPYKDAEETQNPDEVYSKERIVWRGGVTEGSNATTASTFFPSPLLTRGVEWDDSNIGTAANAAQFLAADLDRFSKEKAQVTCTVLLPSTHVGLIDAGQRISVKFVHLDGYEAFTWTRVISRTYNQATGRKDLYEVHLVLGLNGTHRGIGGGISNPPPTTFPPPVPTPTHYYGGTLAATTEHYGSADSSNIGGADSAWVPDGTTASTQPGTKVFHVGVTYNWDVVFTFDPLDEPVGGRQFGLGLNGSWYSMFHVVDNVSPHDHYTGSFTPAADATYEFVMTNPGFSHGVRPFSAVYYIDPVGWVSTPTPPSPGQENARPEIATMTGVNGTTVFPFADGTLRVLYDIVDQTPAIVSYNGAAGTFVMPSAPPLGTQVFVEYLGR